MSKKGNDSIKAIQMIMNQLDGRPGGKAKHPIRKHSSQHQQNRHPYIELTSVDQIPEEHRDKAIYQLSEPEAKELPQPYRSEQEVRDKYGLN